MPGILFLNQPLACPWVPAIEILQHPTPAPLHPPNKEPLCSFPQDPKVRWGLVLVVSIGSATVPTVPIALILPQQ